MRCLSDHRLDPTTGYFVVCPMDRRAYDSFIDYHIALNPTAVRIGNCCFFLNCPSSFGLTVAVSNEAVACANDIYICCLC